MHMNPDEETGHWKGMSSYRSGMLYMYPVCPRAGDRWGWCDGKMEKVKENLSLPHRGACSSTSSTLYFPAFPTSDFILSSFYGLFQRTRTCTMHNWCCEQKKSSGTQKEKEKPCRMVFILQHAQAAHSFKAKQGLHLVGKQRCPILQLLVANLWKPPPPSILNLASVLKLYAK